jgi:hypothetical protein
LKYFGRSNSSSSSSFDYVIIFFRICKTHHDNASKFIHILVLSSPVPSPPNRHYLTVDDWDYLIQDIIDTHPGLKFLREAREFHSRYIKTVVARVYYNCNRSWSGKLTVQELRRSNFLSVEYSQWIYDICFCFSRLSIESKKKKILIVFMIIFPTNIFMLFIVNFGN